MTKAAQATITEVGLAKLICPNPFHGHPYNTNNKLKADATKAPKMNDNQKKKFYKDILNGDNISRDPPPDQCWIGSSHTDAVQQILCHLHHYYPSLTTSIGTKVKLNAIKEVKGGSFGKGIDNFTPGRANQLIYCQNCMHLDLTDRTNPLHVCVVAEISCKHEDLSEGVDNEDEEDISEGGNTQDLSCSSSCGEAVSSWAHLQCEFPQPS